MMLVESTTMTSDPCIVTGKRFDGVQAHDLANAINDYDGAVWIARLAPEQSLCERESARLTKMAMAKIGTPYDQIGAIVSGTRFVKRMPWYYERVNHAYCSELAGWLLKNINRWPWESASTLTPAGMARDGVRTGRYLPLELVKKK